MEQQPPSIHDLHNANEWRIKDALALLREASQRMEALNVMRPDMVQGTIWRLVEAAGLAAYYLAQVHGMQFVPNVATSELTGRGYGLRIADDVLLRMQHRDEVDCG